MLCFLKSSWIILLSLFIVVKAQSQPIERTIKIAIIQPFAVKSSTGSTRYISNFESSVYYALGKNEKKINRCGAKYLVNFEYFSADSLVEAIKLTKSIDKSDYWLIVGPTRAKHFITVIDNIKNTPIISLNSAIQSKTKKIISISKSVDLLASTLAKKINKEGKVKNYGVLVDVSCPECIAFEKTFTKKMKKHSINRVFKTESNDFEYQTDLDKLFINLDKHKEVNALLVPNYSKLSGYVISQVHLKYPQIIFLGGDGWGYGNWSFLPQFKLPNTIEAYSIRSYLPAYKANNVNSLDMISETNMAKPSDLSLSTIYLFDELTDIICKNNLKTITEFSKFIQSQDKNFMNKNTELGLYKLHNGKLKFEGKIS